MANENFTKDDHKWTVRYGFPRDYQSWSDFYGDEYNWTSMVPILWQSIDLPAARILPPKVTPNGFSQETCAWWSGALHLLAFGMGWTNMPNGLRRWRENGYPTDNAVLRLLFNTYGSSIEALEYWLQGHDFTHILGVTNESRYFNHPSSDSFNAQLERLTDSVNSGPRHQLTQQLLNWNDHLHLNHFLGSVGDQHNPRAIIDEELMDGGETRRQLRVRRYVGWHRAVSQYLREELRAERNSEVSAAVLISQIGYLGTYALAPQTGIAFRRSPRTEFSLDLQFHMMGN
jgi:hypothetical protein